MLLHQGRPDEAVAEYQTALRINPDNAGALCSLGNVLSSLGRLDEAAQNYESAIRLNPNLFEPHYNLGNLRLEQKRHTDAIEHYQRAVHLNPGHIAIYHNWAAVLREQGRIAEQCHVLALAAKTQDKLEEAERLALEALQLRPGFSAAMITLYQVRMAQGEIVSAIALLKEMLRLIPDDVWTLSRLAATMHYLPDYTPQELLAAAQDCASHLTLHNPQLPSPANHPDPQRPLRIGYVSGDFHNHPVGHFIAEVLAHHDKSRHEIICYYNNFGGDGLTRRLQHYTDKWRVIIGKSDAEVAGQIREDGIDVLVDLSGYTGGSRLAVFARKPAPVQATWLGYFDTTGLDAMDYIVADRLLIPPEEESYYSERVVRLPDAYLCFSPPEPAVPLSPLPALSAGTITFGCFNNNGKLTGEVIACWSRILQKLPNARLYLKYKPYSDAGVRHRYQQLFADHGIAVERIHFAGQTSREDNFATYHQVDIGLDPFPFNGCTTTLETLWMGVPVVNLRGDRYVAHMGETILSNLGLQECVADTPDDYIAKAVALASNLSALATLRSGLRERLQNSPLYDGRRFTHHLEEAYRAMWASWCRQQTQA